MAARVLAVSQAVLARRQRASRAPPLQGVASTARELEPRKSSASSPASKESARARARHALWREQIVTNLTHRSTRAGFTKTSFAARPGRKPASAILEDPTPAADRTWNLPPRRAAELVPSLPPRRLPMALMWGLRVSPARNARSRGASRSSPPAPADAHRASPPAVVRAVKARRDPRGSAPPTSSRCPAHGYPASSRLAVRNARPSSPGATGREAQNANPPRQPASDTASNPASLAPKAGAEPVRPDCSRNHASPAESPAAIVRRCIMRRLQNIADCQGGGNSTSRGPNNSLAFDRDIRAKFMCARL